MSTTGKVTPVPSKPMLWLAIGLAVAGCVGTGRPAPSEFALEPGDLLFLDADAGPLCDAIEEVTHGYDGANLSHVGIVARGEDERLIVIEAVSKGVTRTPLPAFMARSLDDRQRPKVMVGRLQEPYRALIAPALREARALEGKPYDKVFAVDNDAYYCSELVYEVFRRANGGKPLFELRPMTFKPPGSDEPFAAWRRYFAELGTAIPEGQSGINPGGISRSPALVIVYEYGAVTRKAAR